MDISVIAILICRKTMSCTLLGISLLAQFAHIFSVSGHYPPVSISISHTFFTNINAEFIADLKRLFIIGMRATYHTVILSCLLSIPTSY